MTPKRKITEDIKSRSSWRSYLNDPIAPEIKKELIEFMDKNTQCPFKSRARFILTVATENDTTELKGLSTFGFIKNPRAFIIGAVEEGEKGLEDYGYLMENIILFATHLGLGTCWLGGSFSKSTFGEKIEIQQNEILPAVAAIGNSTPKRVMFDKIARKSAFADNRRPWKEIFFKGNFSTSLLPDETENYKLLLEMVRLAPSATNRQPWRIVKDRNSHVYHFYLKPAKRMKLMFIENLQHVDMGVAMCHFELTAKEEGLSGSWVISDPAIKLPNKKMEYIASWIGN